MGVMFGLFIIVGVLYLIITICGGPIGEAPVKKSDLEKYSNNGGDGKFHCPMCGLREARWVENERQHRCDHCGYRF